MHLCGLDINKHVGFHFMMLFVQLLPQKSMCLPNVNKNLAMKIMTKFVDLPTSNKHFANRWTSDSCLYYRICLKNWL